MPKKLKLGRYRKYHYKKKMLVSSPRPLPQPVKEAHGALTENETSSLVLSIPLTAACVPTLIVMQKLINQLSVLPPGIIGLFITSLFVL